MSLLIVLASAGIFTASVTTVTALGIRYARRVLEGEEKARADEIALEREILALERVKYETENYEVLAPIRKQEAEEAAAREEIAKQAEQARLDAERAAEEARAAEEKARENDRLITLPVLQNDDGKAILHCYYCDCEVKKDKRWHHSKWKEARQACSDASYVQELARDDDALGPTFGVSVRLSTPNRRYDGQLALLQACTRCQQEWVLFVRTAEEKAEIRSRKT